MPVEIVTGTPGAGKTMYLVRQMFRDKKRAAAEGVRQITNINVNPALFPQLLYVPTQDLSEQIYHWVDQQEHFGSYVYVMEGGVIWPSMDYKNIPKKIIMALVEHRHNGFSVMIDCQSFDQLTTGIRRVCQYVTEIDGWPGLRFSSFTCYGCRNGKINYKDKYNRGRFFHSKKLYLAYNTYSKIDKPRHLDVDGTVASEKD